MVVGDFLDQKSRLCWLKEGDANMRFFHRVAVCRRARNLIKKIKAADGDGLTRREGITKHFFDYFCDRWRPNVRQVTQGELDVKLINGEDNVNMIAPVMKKEIKDVVNSMPMDKALGPDGLSIKIFKRYWDDVAPDLVAVMDHFFSSAKLIDGWKSTFITLIPKVSVSHIAKDFGAISLCNVTYKIISKLLVNRFKSVLTKIISQEQSAFFSRRIISDNFLAAQEALHSMGNRKEEGELIAVKLDMKHAYDLMG